MTATTRRALTSLEEKIKVCERPDRLGSATNPEMSELGLAGLESSMTEKLWNNGKEGTHLLKQHQPKHQFLLRTTAEGRDIFMGIKSNYSGGG